MNYSVCRGLFTPCSRESDLQYNGGLHPMVKNLHTVLYNEESSLHPGTERPSYSTVERLVYTLQQGVIMLFSEAVTLDIDMAIVFTFIEFLLHLPNFTCSAELSRK
jgi:hypothetical protein